MSPVIAAAQTIFAASVFIFGPSFIHSDGSIAQERTMKRSDGGLCLFGVGHLEECEPA